MKSDDITVQQLFQDRRQYMVPFYQRAYVWTLSSQWGQLWEDIRAKADSRMCGNMLTPHFLGAIVLDPQPRVGLIGVDTLHIIDGQQRLTTLQFVLKSVQLALKAVKATAISEIISGTLRNSNPDTMRDPKVEAFKVWPTFRDRKHYQMAFGVPQRDALKKIFPDSFTQTEKLRKIGIRHPSPLEAIWFFTENFEAWIREGGESEVAIRSEILATSILQDLKVVSIVLDEDDDAQVIFETLNGRGAQLHATDLIRNFIFMRADREGSNSESLYNDLWSNFEVSYWNSMQRRGRMKKPRIEWFIHVFLQAVMCEEVDLGRLYYEYRKYVLNFNEPKNAESQLALLLKFSDIYRRLVDGEGESSIANFGLRIAPFEVTTIHPLALLIGSSDIADEDKRSMYNLLVSYVVRRSICGLTQKNYNNVFISLLRNLAKSELSTDCLCSLLMSLNGEGSRWPRDEEFEQSLRSADIYPGRLEPKKMRAVLSELEYELRGSAKIEDMSKTDLSHLDIDHILPQSWFSYWPLANGQSVRREEISGVKLKQLMDVSLSEHEQSIITREEVIKTLGNLTLLNLSVNRSAQNKNFADKKKQIIENTNLRLNISLIGLSSWDELEITKRSDILAKCALRIWPGIKAEQGS